jgi:hypothetical protein
MVSKAPSKDNCLGWNTPMAAIKHADKTDEISCHSFYRLNGEFWNKPLEHKWQ